MHHVVLMITVLSNHSGKTNFRYSFLLMLTGDVPMPYFSPYNATKAAVKSLTESLAYEVRDWGVKVILIAPAAFKTGMVYVSKTCKNAYNLQLEVVLTCTGVIILNYRR